MSAVLLPDVLICIIQFPKFIILLYIIAGCYTNVKSFSRKIQFFFEIMTIPKETGKIPEFRDRPVSATVLRGHVSGARQRFRPGYRKRCFHTAEPHLRLQTGGFRL